MRLLFAGTPDVAVPSLEALAARFDVAVVLTRPDAVRGRGRTKTPSPVKAAAQRLGIPVLDTDPRNPEFPSALSDLGIDAAVVVAYGKILRQPVLDAVPLGWYNLHFSLLPAWRGAAPVQRAIWQGDEETGLTVFKLTAGMDSGPIVRQIRVPIEGRPSAGELLEDLAAKGAPLLVEAMEAISTGSARLTPQSGEAGNDRAIAQKITIEDAHADFTLEAEVVDRRIRACNPDPGAWALIDSGETSEKLRLNEVTPVEVDDPALATALAAEGDTVLQPGVLIVSKKHVWVVCEQGYLELLNVTAAGKKPMIAADWARGARLAAGARLV